MANLKKIAAFGAAFLGGCLLGGAAGIYGEKKYQVSEKFSKKQEATPSAEVVMAQQTSQQNSKPVMNNNNNGNSNHPQQK